MNISSAKLVRSVLNATTKSRRLASINASACWSTCVPGAIVSSVNQIVASGMETTPNSRWNHARSFSTFSAPLELRTFPQYSVYGETTMFSLKLNLPTFVVRKNVLGVETNQRGRVLFEWVPREADGKFQ
jgi:hypothetical protein